MAVAGIYPVSDGGPQLSDREAALLASLPDRARSSKLASHDDLRVALVAMAEQHDYDLRIEINELGFAALVGTALQTSGVPSLRVVANKRGTGEETFYCQCENAELLRQLAEQIARACGPQLVLPVDGDDGVLVVAQS